ncbi:protein spaetzle 3 isoform X2 [Drosophila guanche]|uniref:protein spaetzle 3 isoform X2 n=1 Tax=Drosophila guanche TaxID=7266 RepID=UPI0014720969|nr:protein spaetzle 3 isoform X2 [Drosophila guanche]
MALTNFSLPFGALGQPWGVTLAPLHPIHQLASNTNNLLYSPADHQQQHPQQQGPTDSEFFKNNPYAPPQHTSVPQAQGASAGYPYQSRRKQNNAYLPPTGPAAARNSVYHIQQQTQQQQQQEANNENSVSYQSSTSSRSSSAGQSTIQLTQTHHSTGRGPGEGSYSRFPGQQQKQFFNAHGSASATFSKNSGSFSITSYGSRQQPQPQPQPQQQAQPQAAPPAPQLQQQPPPPAPQSQQQQPRTRQSKPEAQPASTYGVAAPENYPERAPGFTRVQAGQGSRTQVHAVLDYDVEEGDEEDEEDEDEDGQYYEGQEKAKANSNQMPTVTPIQGPIYLKNGTVPVVPLFSYPKLNNGSFLQIPIWWTALSVALGLDVRGDVIKGVPCIKRFHQLFCPTAGNSYPIDKIERFIDDNKALMRRMYGDFEMNMEGPAGGGNQQPKVRKRRFIDEPDIFIPPGAHAAHAAHAGEAVEAGDSYFGQLRKKRQAAVGGSRNRGAGNSGSSGAGSSTGSNASRTPGSSGAGQANSGTGRLDACESKIEIVTPYWASNSAGKIRAIVNTQHFEQAIHQEVCSNTQTSRCEGECGCEQKYKWHRLLAYDPDNDCKGIFMDWFLFPSCCVCRCNP